MLKSSFKNLVFVGYFSTTSLVKLLMSCMKCRYLGMVAIYMWFSSMD